MTKHIRFSRLLIASTMLTIASATPLWAQSGADGAANDSSQRMLLPSTQRAEEQLRDVQSAPAQTATPPAASAQTTTPAIPAEPAVMDANDSAAARAVLPKGKKKVVKEEQDEENPTIKRGDEEIAKSVPSPQGTAIFRESLGGAYVNNPRLKAEREALKAVDETVSQAVSGFRPSVTATADKGRVRAKLASQGSDRWGYTDSASRELIVTQPLFSGGSSVAATNSARNRVKAGRQQLKTTEQQVLLEAVQAYMDVIQNKSVAELSRNNVNVLGEQRKATKDRFDVGEVTRTDVAQSEARSARASSDVSTAEGEYEAARAQFQQVIGYEPGELKMPEEDITLPATLDEAIAVAEQNSPQLLTAHYSEKSAKSDVNFRLASLLPTVALQGTMIREEDANARAGVAQDVDALMMNVTIPLYQSGAEYSRVREAKARYQQRRLDTIDAGTQMRENVTAAWERYHAAKRTIDSNKSAIDAARVALDGVTQEQQYGARTTLDVLDAEQELFVTRVNLVRAERNEKVAYYNLLATMGKLTAKDLGLNVEVYDPEDNYDTVKWLPVGF